MQADLPADPPRTSGIVASLSDRESIETVASAKWWRLSFLDVCRWILTQSGPVIPSTDCRGQRSNSRNARWPLRPE